MSRYYQDKMLSWHCFRHCLKPHSSLKRIPEKALHAQTSHNCKVHLLQGNNPKPFLSLKAFLKVSIPKGMIHLEIKMDLVKLTVRLFMLQWENCDLSQHLSDFGIGNVGDENIKK